MIPLRRTRLTRFELARLGLTVVVVMAALGALVSLLRTKDPVREARSLSFRGDDEGALDLLRAHVEHATDDREAFVLLVDTHGHATARRLEPELAALATGVARRPITLDDDALGVILATSRAISPRALAARHAFARTGDLDAALDRVFADPPSVRDLVELGRVAHDYGLDEAATALFALVLESPSDDAGVARALALESAASLAEPDRLRALLGDPRFRAVASDDVLFVAAEDDDDHVSLVRLAWRMAFSRMTPVVIATCLVVGGAWMFFLLVVGAAWEWSWSTRAKAALGIVAGLASGLLTLAVVVVMDDLIEHAAREQTILYQLVYCVFGIGFREEMVKLLCIAPVLLLMKKTEHEGVLLIVASLGGLGFAIEENASYFDIAMDASPVVIARFLTANFLHLSLTGLVGFHFALAVRRGGKEWDTFTTTFIQAVVAHGLYDFLLMAPLGDGMSMFAMTVFVWIAQRYLTDLIAYFPMKTRPVALSTALTITLAVAVGANFDLVAIEVGVRAALDLTFLGLLGNAIIAIVFYRSLGEEIL